MVFSSFVLLLMMKIKKVKSIFFLFISFLASNKDLLVDELNLISFAPTLVAITS